MQRERRENRVNTTLVVCIKNGTKQKASPQGVPTGALESEIRIAISV